MTDQNEKCEPEFVGFVPPAQNYSKLPHSLIESLHIMRSEAEVKCVLYILRHTWGFSEFDEPKHMTLNEFMEGRKRSDGTRLDKGTGLSKPAVIKGLRAAATHGFIEVTIGDDSDGGRIEKLYRLAMRKQHLPHESTPFTAGVNNIYPSEEIDDMGKQSLQVTVAQMGKQSLHRTEKERSAKETLNTDAPNGANGVESETLRIVRRRKSGDPEVRSDVFKAIALGSFNISDVSKVSATTEKKVDRLEKWLKKNSPGATVRTVEAFYDWYRRITQGRIATPRTIDTFGTRFDEFRQQNLRTSNPAAPPSVPPPVHLSDEQKQQRREDRDRILAEAQGVS